MLEIFYDRRNQIAHEGDWDSVQLDFGSMQKAHLADSTQYVVTVASAIDPLL